MNARAVQSPMDLLGSALRLEQLLDAASVDEILGSFYGLFRIPIRILGEDGASFSKTRKASPLNEYLGQLPQARRSLGEVHGMLRKHQLEDSAEFSHTAFTGASYHVAMIGHEGRRIGRFILGPFITPNVREAPLSLVECDPNIEIGRARELLLSLPRVREDTVKAIARHVAVTLDVLVFAGHKALLTEYMHLSTVQENQRQLSAKAEGLVEAEERLVEAARLESDTLGMALGALSMPLRALVADSDLLTDGAPSHPQRDLVVGIRQRARELLELSERVVEFSKIDSEAIALRREQVDVRALLDRVAAQSGARLGERSVELGVSCQANLVPARLDPASIARALMLLVENALRFADRGSITLEARSVPERSGGGDTDSDGLVLLGSPAEVLELRVADVGSGIADGEKARVFEPFYQGAVGSRSAGCGLGLTIAKRLVEAHGGTLDVEDNQPRGAVFVLRLPASDAAPASRGSEHSA